MDLVCQVFQKAQGQQYYLKQRFQAIHDGEIVHVSIGESTLRFCTTHLIVYNSPFWHSGWFEYSAESPEQS